MLLVLLYAALAALALACVALYAYLRHALAYWQRRGVAFEPPSAPFGNYAAAVLGRSTMGEASADMYFRRRDQRFLGTYFLGTPLLQLQDPDIIQQVLIREFQDFNGRGTHSDPDNDKLSGNLFVLSGQPWRNLRVKLSPTFTSGKIRYMFETVVTCADQMAEHVTRSMQEGGGRYEEDVRELLARLFTDLISSVAFGIESNSMRNPHSEFRRMGQRAVEPSAEVAMRFTMTFFAGGLMKAFGIRTVPRDVHEFFTRTVQKTVRYREDHGVERADMLNLLIKLKNEGFLPPDSRYGSAEADGSGNLDGKNHMEKSGDASGVRLKLTEQQIPPQMFIFFLGGFETTSTTTSFTLYEVAKQPRIQDRLHAEVDAALARHGGKITYDLIMNLPYMEMVISETTRMYPALPFITRETMVQRQLPLTDLPLERGTRLLIPVLALHTDPEYWPDPEHYDPERFTEEAKKARRPGTFLPFGDGPRMCIGFRLGMVQVKVALVTILSRCRVSLAPGIPLKARISPRSIIPNPIDGVRLILSDRSKGAS